VAVAHSVLGLPFAASQGVIPEKGQRTPDPRRNEMIAKKKCEVAGASSSQSSDPGEQDAPATLLPSIPFGGFNHYE